MFRNNDDGEPCLVSADHTWANVSPAVAAARRAALFAINDLAHEMHRAGVHMSVADWLETVRELAAMLRYMDIDGRPDGWSHGDDITAHMNHPVRLVEHKAFERSDPAGGMWTVAEYVDNVTGRPYTVGWVPDVVWQLG